MRSGQYPASLLLALSLTAAAQNSPRSLHLEGAQARRLISLLVSGNNAIAATVKDHNSNRILLHGLQVEKESTYKYDDGAPYFRLDVYRAHAQLGDSQQQSSLGEATGLYELLSSVGLKPDMAMDGAYLEAQTVDCRINTHIAFDKPQRFVCDLKLPF
jgi:hypothetical protein